MATPKPKPKGKLTKNKYVIAGVIVVAGALFYFYYKNKNATSSAGSSSTPQDASTGAGLTPSDSTGGGSGSGPDLSGLFNLLASDNSLIAQLVGNGGSGAPVAPLTSTPTPTDIHPPLSPSTAGGGNVAGGTTATQTSQPTTSLPDIYKSIVTGIPAPSPSIPNSAPLPTPAVAGNDWTTFAALPTSANPVSIYKAPASSSTANDLNDVMYSPPLVTLATTKPPAPKPKAPVSGYSQKSGSNLH